MPKTKTSEKPWEALGVSRSKYYRDQRTGTKKPKTKTPPAKKRGRPRKVAAQNGQQWMVDREANDIANMTLDETPVTADGAAAKADGAPRRLWQAVDIASVTHERVADEALLEDFMCLTDADVAGDTRLFHFSARMVGALRRAIASS